MTNNLIKKQKPLLLIAMSLLLVIIGLTVAYFVLDAKGNDTVSRNAFRSGNLEVILDGKSTMVANALKPGDTISKTFTVRNTGSINIESYDIYFSNLVNSYKYSELVYTLTCSATSGSCNGKSQTPVGTSYEDLIINNAIAVGVTQTYTLTITFIETSSLQDYNKNQTFSFIIKVNETAPYVAGDHYSMNIAVDFNSSQKDISPYIYGINEYFNKDNLSSVTASAIRQGGNRYTTYNWENNASNAGADWLNSSDGDLSNLSTPGYCATNLSAEANTYNFDYKLTTLQMAGYVAADKNGVVSSGEAAPSSRWKAVDFTKGSAFSLTPNTSDDYVYMDEYVNFLVNTLGSSTTANGINGYILDNEPSLWDGNHSLVVSSNITSTRLINDSVALAKAVKAVDANAEIFAPALYGFSSFVEFTNLSEWTAIKNNYDWFIDYYLQQMKAASDTYGSRLLDVFDVHYFSEDVATPATRVQAVRTLYEEGYAENSWIGTWYQRLIPILGHIQSSIDTYYPGTKLSITEYSFGGGTDASGAVAQAEALGTFADNDVYLATYWGVLEPYIVAGINMYTNYDGTGSSFGDKLIESSTTDVSKSTVFSSVHTGNTNELHIVITNKDATKPEDAVISIAGAPKTYNTVKAYYVDSTTSGQIENDDALASINGTTANVVVPPMSVVHVILSYE